jgi:hypothetical protein
LDAIPWGIVNLYLAHDRTTLAWNGFLIMLFLLVILLQSMIKHRGKEYDNDFNSPVNTFLLVFAGFFFVVMLFFSLSAYKALVSGEKSDILASDNSIFSFPFVFTDANLIQEQREILQRIPVLNNSFEEYPPITLSHSGSFSNNPLYPWYFYSYGEPGAMRASITREKKSDGKKSLKLEVVSAGAKGQINMGRFPFSNYIPTQEDDLYLLQADVIASASGAVLSVRFADDAGDIISGSDQVVRSVDRTYGWQQISNEFVPERGSTYAEVLFSLYPPDGEQLRESTTVYLDNIQLFEARKRTDYEWTFGQISEVEKIKDNILTREDSKKFFKARIVFPDLKSLNKIQAVRLNACEPERNTVENNDVVYYFDAGCLSLNNRNSLQASFVNLIHGAIEPIGSLAHERVNFIEDPMRKGLLYVCFTLGMLLDICLIAYLIRKFYFIYE